MRLGDAPDVPETRTGALRKRAPVPIRSGYAPVTYSTLITLARGADAPPPEPRVLSQVKLRRRRL
jgi:hypothetical protein